MPFRIPQPFDHPKFILEPKVDGFGALAHIDGSECRLVSGNRHLLKRSPKLAAEVASVSR
jgi:hypothetical protein